MADRMFTSKEAEEIIVQLHYATKLEYGALARLALAYSLMSCGKTVPKILDFSGKEIRDRSIFDNDNNVYRSIVNLIYNEYHAYDDTFFSKISICKDHIDNGLILLNKVFQECNRKPFAFLKKLAEEAKNYTSENIVVDNLDLNIGVRSDLNHVILELNNAIKHANSHIAIMGKPGVGKTQLILKMLIDIRQLTQYRTNFIFFDYKGDVINNNRFLELSKALSFDIAQQPLPINPFVLQDYSENSILFSAREKAESFASIDNRFGTVQKGSLTDIIQLAYENRQSSNLPYPDFDEILNIARQKYISEGKQDDTLIQILKDLASFSLFWKHGTRSDIIEKLTERTLVIDLHKLPVLKELVTYLVIERLYKELTIMPDSEITNGRRFLRTILVIDEAHNYLPQKNPFLQKIVREGRSKGVAVFFASQSPNDYNQKYFDFKELLEFSLIFNCDGVQAPTIQDLIGCNVKISKDLQTEVSNLRPFEVISKALGQDKEFTKFTAAPFYKEYR